MWRGIALFLRSEQVLAYWKCGEKIPLFLRSEPGTCASLQKMWSGDRTFFFCGLNLEQVLAELTEIVEREIGIADFSQSMGMRVSLAFFFALFHIFFTFFTLFSFFFIFFYLSFFAFFFALSLTWPRPQPCRLSLPSLNVPHTTSPLLSFLNTI